MTRYEMPGSDDQLLWATWLSACWSPSVMVADELGIFTSLAASPASIDELSKKMGLNRRALGALLPLLASLGYLVPRLKRYHITDTTRHYLMPRSPFYWGGVFVATRECDPAYAMFRKVLTHQDLHISVAQESDRRPADSWASGRITLDHARVMVRFMHSHSMATAVSLAQNEDFSNIRRLLDVGGGSGCISIALAQRNPELHCTVMDLPPMCSLALAYIAQSGVSDRVDTYGKDMFREGWPGGYDAILFSNVFHDWSFETCAALSKVAYEMLPKGGSIYLHEALLSDDGSGPRTAAAFSVLMVLTNQGQQFTFGELQGLLRGAGFVDVECKTTSPLFSVVRGLKC